MHAETIATENCPIGIIPAAPWRIAAAEYAGQWSLRVTCNDGISGVIDLSGLIFSDNAGVYSRLRAPDCFMAFFLEYGTITWPGEIDLAPDVIHDLIEKNSGSIVLL